MNYKGHHFLIAKTNAKQTMQQISSEIKVSVSTLQTFEKTDVLPNSEHLQKAIFNYIKKHSKTKKVVKK